MTKTSAIALSRVNRFQLRLLSRRNEVSVLFKIFDDLLADNLSLEAAKSAFDGFVSVY